MPMFTPPTILEAADDHFWGRYSVPVGQSVVKTNGTYKTTPYPWLGDIKSLTEGVDYFLGGRTYVVSQAVADALTADGFTIG
ncbi:MAG TPA: hypothetical protein VFH56_14405 [Acidimicrobiales bacterium]|nr:hypothetical protein [Acidimicrobiales bacterium]